MLFCVFLSCYYGLLICTIHTLTDTNSVSRNEPIITKITFTRKYLISCIMHTNYTYMSLINSSGPSCKQWHCSTINLIYANCKVSSIKAQLPLSTNWSSHTATPLAVGSHPFFSPLKDYYLLPVTWCSRLCSHARQHLVDNVLTWIDREPGLATKALILLVRELVRVHCSGQHHDEYVPRTLGSGKQQSTCVGHQLTNDILSPRLCKLLHDVCCSEPWSAASTLFIYSTLNK